MQVVIKTGIVITIKNRYEYTRQTFIDLMESDLPENTLLVLVDDGSDEETQRLINYFPFTTGLEVVVIRNEISIGVAQSLRKGWDYCTDNGCYMLCNLDNDVRIKPEWIKTLHSLYKKFSCNIITGFNANNPKHKILAVKSDYLIKSSIGGINLYFHVDTYAYMRGLLTDNNWDWEISNYFKKFIVCKPSVIQHNGHKAGMHTHSKHHIDIAEDF